MSKALWPAMSGAIARDHEVEVIANNLANVNTNGFKKDQVTFKEYLSKNESDSLTNDIPRSPIKDKDLYPLDGRDQSFVIVQGTHPTHSQGGMKVTDNPLDMALAGPGFFEVSTPNGIRYTRGGSFKMAQDGRLVSSEGYPILSKSDGNEAPSDANARTPASVVEPSARFIQRGGREGTLHVNDSGDIYMGEDLVAKLSVVNFKNLNTIRKAGNLAFENKDPAKNPPIEAAQTEVKQGIIETSNVNPVEEISNMIRANRMFEQDIKAMKTVNEMMQKEVNDVGRVN